MRSPPSLGPDLIHEADELRRGNLTKSDLVCVREIRIQATEQGTEWQVGEKRAACYFSFVVVRRLKVECGYIAGQSRWPPEGKK